MLHTNDQIIRDNLFKCGVGLEKENLRVTKDGFFSRVPHPFSKEDPHIVKEFCESQLEINTEVAPGPREAVEALSKYDRQVQTALRALPEREYLWPFSNPPVIEGEEDIPISSFNGEDDLKDEYMKYLAERYGRYRMTFCGIHFNYSFADELLYREFEIRSKAGEKSRNPSGAPDDFRTFKDNFYVKLARKCVMYGWLIVAVTAASPILDGSFVMKDLAFRTVFNGMASTRCSELGFWNFFTPFIRYDSLESYVRSIRGYVGSKLLRYPSELYYPIRLKPAGKYDLDALLEKGADHIEFRMPDLNPLTRTGIDVRDAEFIQLFIIWAASTEDVGEWTIVTQANATQNFKSAAHLDLDTVRITLPSGESYPATQAAIKVIESIEDFYREYSGTVRSVIEFEKEKFMYAGNRYAREIVMRYIDDFVRKGMARAREMQRESVKSVN